MESISRASRAVFGGALGFFSLLSAACLGNLAESDAELGAVDRQALTSVSVTFQTEGSNFFLCAENGGGSAVNANRTAAQGWETFTLLDQNDGALESGDLVYVQASGGRFLQAAHGGNNDLNAASNNKLAHETFRIVKKHGSGRIQSGDIVGLQAVSSGFWVRALEGGGQAVDVRGETMRAWESFRIGLGGAPGMRLVWSDEFDGPNLDESKWNYEVQRPGWVNNELQNYTNRRRENLRIEDGKLVIEGRKDWFGGHEYSSARIKTHGKASWKYGRIEARIQVPWGWGTWPAFWMMPDNCSRGWPACGEMDIMEHVGYDANQVHATCHSAAYNWRIGEQRTAHTYVPGAVDGFHTYALEWTADRIDVSVDGARYFTLVNEHRGDDWWPFDKNFHVILNLAIGGDWGGARGVDPNTWPQRMLVDYVRVYQW